MQKEFMKTSLPATMAGVLLLAVGLGLGFSALSSSQAEAGRLGLNPFKASREEVRQAYCRYAAQMLAPGASDIRLDEMREGNPETREAPVAAMTFVAGATRGIRCEFVPPELIMGHTRLSAITLDAELLPMETLDAVNVALVAEERAVSK
jgi:hypothetical protein